MNNTLNINNAKNLICPYCGSNAPLENTKKIYGGKNYGFAYICERFPECDAYVGVHRNSKSPLGRLANKERRELKREAHLAFDELWKRKLTILKKEKSENCSKTYARRTGYKWLATQLKIDIKDCHIGMFDLELCKMVIVVCNPYLKKRKFI